MIGTLTVFAHFQRDGNDTDTVVATFAQVNVLSDGMNTTWTATNEAGVVVAKMVVFDDFPVSFTHTAIVIQGILEHPRLKPTEQGDYFGHWEVQQLV